MRLHPLAVTVMCVFAAAGAPVLSQDRLERIQYNNPGLVVDLGVGLWAWPLPMDYDGDGDLDLVVSCPDKPYNGTYFFENPGENAQPDLFRWGLPVFRPATRIANGPTNVQVSYVNGEPIVMTPGKVYADFRERQYDNPIQLPLPEKIDPQYKRYRANQWRLVDWEADGDLDVIIGIEIWDDYGWDDAWDENGNWTNGPLHGFVYLVENVTIDNDANDDVPTSRARQEAVAADVIPLPDDTPWPDVLGPRPVFAPAVKITTTDRKPIDVYGMPSPSFADFDNDGDLDLICGEFLDGFTWFENTAEEGAPRLRKGKRLECCPKDSPDEKFVGTGFELRMNLQMITPVAVDWDMDRRVDLVCGDEDGRVALLSNSGQMLKDVPRFHLPRYFRQEAAEVKFGALCTPFSVDWDNDGDMDLVSGNSAGYIGVIENLEGLVVPKWSIPSRLSITDAISNHVFDFKELRSQAGQNGSIQGPCEAKWGYTTVSVADWDHDGQVDLMVNNIWGLVVWYRNFAASMLADRINGFDEDPRTRPMLEDEQHVIVAWPESPPRPEWNWWIPEDNALVTQWRTTPCVLDWNVDGLNDLVMLDREGYLAFFQREKRGDELVLLPPQRLFKIEGPCEFDQKHQPVGDQRDGLLRLNANRAGASGRRKLHFVDWDGDGRLDLLVNSVNANWLRNVRTDDEGFTWFRDKGPLDDRVLAGHDTSPTTVDWDKNGIPDLLVGAEDGYLYYKRNPRTE